MSRILVLYYSSYGHTAQMAEAVAEGVRDAGHEADIRHVAETAPADVAEQAGFQKMEGHECIEGPDKLTEYDGLVVGSPTRYGRMSSQMASFWDTTGGLGMKGALVGKVEGRKRGCGFVHRPTDSKRSTKWTAPIGSALDPQVSRACRKPRGGGRRGPAGPRSRQPCSLAAVSATRRPR